MAPTTRIDPALDAKVRGYMKESREIVVSEEARLAVPRPQDVAYLRREMVDWWSQRGGWQHQYALQGRIPMRGYEGIPLEAESARWWMEINLREAELYWVSPDMSDVVASLYATIPECEPQPPCESGMVVFAKSMPGTDAQDGGLIYTTALMWGPVTTRLGECVSIETYAHRKVLYPWLWMSEKDREILKEAMPLQMHPTGGSEWPLGTLISDFSVIPHDDPDRQASMIEDRRLLACFWALCSQKITLEERWEPDRRMRRQFERGWRGKPIPPSVRVIRLREPMRRTDGAGTGEVEWSHRWLVGEHWRRQWHGSTGQHVPTLIRSYVKGPSDKPLLIRETVKALVR
jgi:hypothetical protein